MRIVPGMHYHTIELKFRSEIISRQTVSALNRDFWFLSGQNELQNLTFDDLYANDRKLFLLHAVVHAAQIGGQCGVYFVKAGERTNQTLFCAWKHQPRPRHDAKEVDLSDLTDEQVRLLEDL